MLNHQSKRLTVPSDSKTKFKIVVLNPNLKRSSCGQVIAGVWELAVRTHFGILDRGKGQGGGVGQVPDYKFATLSQTVRELALRGQHKCLEIFTPPAAPRGINVIHFKLMTIKIVCTVTLI